MAIAAFLWLEPDATPLDWLLQLIARAAAEQDLNRRLP
jgi:hypothetical protein